MDEISVTQIPFQINRVVITVCAYLRFKIIFCIVIIIFWINMKKNVIIIVFIKYRKYHIIVSCNFTAICELLLTYPRTANNGYNAQKQSVPLHSL
jgi:hypothetical protein